MVLLLSDSPTRSDCYRVTIKREKAPPDKPDAPRRRAGFFSDHVKEGDLLNEGADGPLTDMTKNYAHLPAGRRRG